MPRDSKSPSDTKPETSSGLKPVELLILLMLADEPRHGYGILQAIETTTGGGERLDPGNLYRSLRKLLRAGLIVKDSKGSGSDSTHERRRNYALAATGRRAAQREMRRLEALLQLPSVRSLLATTSERIATRQP